MHHRKLSVIAVVGLLVQGCGTNAPTCADPKTTTAAKELFSEALEKFAKSKRPDGDPQSLIKKLQFDIASIRTVATDDKTGKLSCAGTLSVRVPKDLAEELIGGPTLQETLQRVGGNVQAKGETISGDIAFTSQLTDDKKEQVVGLADYQPLMKTVFRFGQLAQYVPSTPSCMDNKTVALVWKLYGEAFTEQAKGAGRIAPPTYEDLKESNPASLQFGEQKYADSDDVYRCEGTIQVKLSPTIRAMLRHPLFGPRFLNELNNGGDMKFNDDTAVANVEYLSESVAPGNAHQVQMRGHKRLTKALGELLLMAKVAEADK